MQLHLLVIEDEALFLAALTGVLAERMPQLEVHTAISAEQGLRLLHGHSFDVILSDFRLTGLDGMEFLKECKRVQPMTPVILLTGYGDQALEDEAIAQGAYAFLHKPVQVDALQATLSRALRLRDRSGESPSPDPRPTERPHRTFLWESARILERIRDVDRILKQALEDDDKPSSS